MVNSGEQLETLRNNLEFKSKRNERWEEKERSEIIKLLNKNISKTQIFEEMNIFSDWVSADWAHKEETYVKAMEEHIKDIAQKKAKKDIKEEIRELSDKKIIVERLWNETPFFYDNAQIWWIWNKENCFWERKDDTDILLLFEAAGSNTIKNSEKLEWLNAMKQVGRRKVPIEPPKTWIQFKDKLIDVQTMEQKDATPEYLITNPIPWKIADNTDTPNMDRIFTSWVGAENKDILYEIVAYSMLPDYPIQRIFCFVGAGSNGKGKFLNLLSRFIGYNNTTSTELDTLLNSRFELARLYKKLVVIMGETNFNELTKTSIIKKLSGGDLIGFEFKNKLPFEAMNYAKILIATNNLPVTNDKTDGFFRRWLIIDFNNQFTEKKDILEEIPDSEYEALANKSLQTLKGLLASREFTNEGNLEERRKRYEEKSNPVEKFWKETIIETMCDEDYIFKFEIHKRFDEWCKNNRFRTFSETALNNFIKEKGMWEERKYPEWHTSDGTKPFLRCWKGLKWK